LRGLVIVTLDCLVGLERRGEVQIAAMSGVSMAKLAFFAMEAGLTGLEFAHGIPGTVGGGVYMNAGAYGGEIRQVAAETKFLTPEGEVETLSGEAQGFSLPARAPSRSGMACCYRRSLPLHPVMRMSSTRGCRSWRRSAAPRSRWSFPRRAARSSGPWADMPRR